MSEKIPQSEKEWGMVEKNIVEDVRAKLVSELKKAMEVYGPDWVNGETCAGLIEDLEKKRPTKIGGPFYGDYLDGVLYDLGMRSRTDGKYEAVWKELEKGEVEEK